MIPDPYGIAAAWVSYLKAVSDYQLGFLRQPPKREDFIPPEEKPLLRIVAVRGHRIGKDGYRD